MDGPAVGGWDVGGAWGADRRLVDTAKMWDDGTHGDLVAMIPFIHFYTPTQPLLRSARSSNSASSDVITKAASAITTLRISMMRIRQPPLHHNLAVSILYSSMLGITRLKAR